MYERIPGAVLGDAASGKKEWLINGSKVHGVVIPKDFKFIYSHPRPNICHILEWKN